MFQYVSNSPEDTARLAKLIGERVPEGMIFCLYGDLGAGKTLLVQNMAKGMGITEEVTSPTFNLMNVYTGSVHLYHFDLYRLEQEEELDEIGFYDYISDPDGAVVIEWADKFVDSLPEDYILIEIQRDEEEENRRVLSFSMRGEIFEAFLKEVEELCQY